MRLTEFCNNQPCCSQLWSSSRLHTTCTFLCLRTSWSVLAVRHAGTVILSKILGWTVTFCAIIYGPLDRGMIVLQLCRWKFVADFIRLMLTFIQKKKKSLYEPPFLDLRVTYNVRTLSIARWKARDRLYIRQYWTFSLSLKVETL